MATNIKTVMTYPLDGTRTEFDIPFEYLARKFVQVTLIGQDRKVLVLNTDYRFATKAIISTTKAWGPADAYESIEIRRYTSATERLVDFTDGSILRAYDLNISQIQTLHVAEEARDLTADTIGVNNDGNLDARGRKIVNVADATDAGDAVSFGQMQRFDGSSYNSMLKAKESEDKAKTSENNAKSSADRATNEADRAKTEADKTNGKAAEAAQSATAADNSASSASSSAASAAANATVSTQQADRAKTEADKLVEFNELTDRINSVAVAQVGSPEIHVSRLVAKPGTVYADGQLLDRAMFPVLWALIQSGGVPVVAESIWQSQPSRRGCYTTGTNSTNFRVPDYNGKSSGSITAPVFRGDGGGLVPGDVQVSGAPNIRGTISTNSQYSFLLSGSVFTGAFEIGSTNMSGFNGINGGTDARRLEFNARKSSDVYTDGLTEVRANSVVICWVIRTHGVVNNPGSVDAAVLASRIEQVYTELTALAVKVDRKLDISMQYAPIAVAAKSSMTGMTVSVQAGYAIIFKFNTPRPDTDYAVHVTMDWSPSNYGFITVHTKTVNGFYVTVRTTGGQVIDDPSVLSVLVSGRS